MIPINEYEAFYHFAWNGSAGVDRADTALQLKNAQWTVECLQMAKDWAVNGLCQREALWNMKR